MALQKGRDLHLVILEKHRIWHGGSGRKCGERALISIKMRITACITDPPVIHLSPSRITTAP